MKTRAKVTTLTGLVLIAMACNGNEDSKLSVTNGIKKQPSRYTAIITDGCSGTFVSPTTILTAAHCADHGWTYNGKKSVKNIVMDGWNNDNFDKGDIVSDMRILVFDSPVAPAWIAVSSNSNFVKGDPLVVAGYGTYDAINGKGDGQFRYGTTSFSNYDSDNRRIISYGSRAEKVEGTEGTNSSVGPGDSGGPLLYKGAIVGVASRAGDAGDGKQIALHISTNHPLAKAFFKKAIDQGADIRFDVPNSIVYDECVDVAANKDLNEFNFEVPHQSIASVVGEWSSCICDECPSTNAAGYLTGVYKDLRPKYSNVAAGALMLWGRKNSDPAKKDYDKGFAWKEGFSGTKTSYFGAKLQIHSKEFTNNKGTLKVCFR